MTPPPDIAPSNPVDNLRLAMRQLCLAAEEVALHNAALADALVGMDADGKAVDPVYHLTEAKLRIEDFIAEVLLHRDRQADAVGIWMY